MSVPLLDACRPPSPVACWRWSLVVLSAPSHLPSLFIMAFYIYRTQASFVGLREPGDAFGKVGERGYRISLSCSPVCVLFSCQRFHRRECAPYMGHGMWWFDVRAGTLLFVHTALDTRTE